MKTTRFVCEYFKSLAVTAHVEPELGLMSADATIFLSHLDTRDFLPTGRQVPRAKICDPYRIIFLLLIN